MSLFTRIGSAIFGSSGAKADDGEFGLSEITSENFQDVLAACMRAIYGGAFADEPERRAELYLRRGDYYFALGRYEDALSDYDRSIELNPRWTDAYHSRLSILDANDAHEEIIRDADTVLSYEPDNAYFWYMRGTAYLNLRQLDEAMRDLERSIALDPNFAKAYGNRGLVHEFKERYEEAIADHTRAIEADPDWTDPYYNRGRMYARLGDVPKGVEDFLTQWKLAPDQIVRDQLYLRYMERYQGRIDGVAGDDTVAALTAWLADGAPYSD